MESAGPTASGQKLDSQTKGAGVAPDSRTNSTSTRNIGAANKCINIPDYFRSSANKEANKQQADN